MEKEKYLKFAEDFLASFLGKFGLIHHHLSSYNSAISELIPNYLYNLKHEIKDTEGNVKSTICFTNLRFKPPEHNEDNTPILVFPRFAERNNMNYTSEMIVDIIIRESGKETVHENFELGHMPIMVKSCLCPTSRADSETMYAMKEDPNEIGGHFIYNGNPKFVLPIFHIGMNRLDVFPFRSNPQMSYHVEVRSSENILHNTTCVIGIDSKGCIVSTLPFFTFTIPIIAVLLSFGLENDEQIVETIFSEWEIRKLNIKPLVKSLEYSYEMTTKEQAYRYIGTQIKKSAKKEVEEVEDEEDSSEIKIEAKEVDFEAIGKKFMQNEYLPHVGRNDGSDMVKLYTVLWILRKIIIAYNDGKTVDRDHMKDKRTTSIGQLITTQFISGMRRMLSDSSKECLRKMTKKENYDVMRTLHNNHINRAMTGAISTSNWARGGKGKVGITQLQERFVNLQVLCRLRKFKHFLPAGTRVLGPRKKHMSSINIMCSAETPEGPDIGLIQSMSMLATTTMGVDTYVMGAFMKNNFDICPVNKKDTIYDTILIIVNGRIIGTISQKYYKIFVEEFHEKRRNGTIPYEVSIETKENYIEIHSDDERFISCYLIVKEGNLPIMKHKELPKFDTLLNTGCVEFLDKYEEESCVICPSLEDFEGMEIEERAKYTHCVVHPSLIDGLGANMIPYRNRNQAPRNIFQCNMGNQTMGIIKLNAMHLSGQPTTIIGYPQKPLVSTFVQRALGLDEMPAGQSVKVAIAPYMQINVEDSQVMSKKFVDMGGGMHLRYWTVSMVCYTNEVFKKPGDNCKKDVSINYSKLGEDGIVMRQMTVEGEKVVNTKLVNGDAIVCKVKHIPGKNPPYVAEVIKYTEMETGYIQDINVFKDSTGSTVVKITLVKVHFPEAGDKWAMRNAQKGVIGEIVPVEDLPFFIDGTTPDIIFSPNGIVSRMTISLLIEMVSGKIVASQSELHKLKVKDLYDLVCKKKWKTTPKWLETMDYEKIGKKLEEKPEFTEATIKYIQDSNIPPESKLKYYADATAFETEDDILGRLGEELKKYGFSEFGGEMMTDGRTGEMMPCLIMTGLMTYQPLKHLVGRKVQARGDEQGKRQRLNRQPVEGRQKGGGGRHGVMERDSCGAQGVSAIQFSKLVEQSDEYITTICTVCGLLCHDNTCKSCGNSKVEIIRIPYATKTVNQMLQSMNATFGLCKNPEN